MVELKINDEILNVPTEWKDIKLKDYIAISNLTLLDDIDEMTDTQKSAEVLAILLKRPLGFFYLLKLSEFNKLVDSIAFLTTPIEPRMISDETVKVGDKIFYIKNDMNEITLGEQISYQTVIQKTEQKLSDCMAPSLAIMLVEDLEKEFDAKEYLEKIKYIEENIEYEMAFNLSAFFLSGSTEL